MKAVKDLDDMKENTKEKGTEAESKTKTLFFEYDLATSQLKLLPDFTPPRSFPTVTFPGP